MLQRSTLFIIQQPLLIKSHAFLEQVSETCDMSEAKSTTRPVSTALVRFQQLNRPLVRFQQRDHKKRSLAGAPCDPCPQPAHAASLYHLRMRMQRLAVAHARDALCASSITSGCVLSLVRLSATSSSPTLVSRFTSSKSVRTVLHFSRWVLASVAS